MKTIGSSYLILLALAVLALSQIMCNAPTKEETKAAAQAAAQASVDSSDFEQIFSGVFDVTVTDQIRTGHSDCPGDLTIPYFGPVVSFESFDENRIILTTPEGKEFFSKVAPGKFCSIDGDEETSNKVVCLENLSGAGYIMTMNVRGKEPDGTFNTQECYRATHILTSTIDELINEVLDEDGEPETPPDSELQPDPVPEQPELQLDPAPEQPEP